MNTTIVMKKMIIGMAAVLMIAACSNNSKTDSAQDEADVTPVDTAALRVAVMPTLDCLPLFVAEETGLFEQNGVSVSLCPFQAQMDCDTAVAGGSVHGMMTDLVRAERLQQRGTALYYASATDLHWQLMTGKQARIRQLKQLDDKMLAVTRYSGTALLADMLVDSAKLQTDRVFRIQVNDVDVRLSMMQTGVMDAMLLPEPQATVARQLGTQTLYDSGKGNIRLGVMAFTQKTMDRHDRAEQVKAFVKAYKEACEDINSKGVNAYGDILTRRCHIQQSLVDSIPQDITFSGVGVPRTVDVDRAKNWLKKQK